MNAMVRAFAPPEGAKALVKMKMSGIVDALFYNAFTYLCA